MKLTQYETTPKACERGNNLDEAWWYAMKSGIEIHIPIKPGRYHHVVKISKRAIQRYIKKMETA